MTYLRVSIARWRVDAGSSEAEEIVRKVREEGLSLLERQDGFISYQAAFVDSRTTLTIMQWQLEGQCMTGMQRWVEWMEGSGVAQQMDGQPQRYTGEVLISS